MLLFLFISLVLRAESQPYTTSVTYTLGQPIADSACPGKQKIDNTNLFQEMSFFDFTNVNGKPTSVRVETTFRSTASVDPQLHFSVTLDGSHILQLAQSSGNPSGCASSTYNQVTPAITGRNDMTALSFTIASGAAVIFTSPVKVTITFELITPHTCLRNPTASSVPGKSDWFFVRHLGSDFTGMFFEKDNLEGTTPQYVAFNVFKDVPNNGKCTEARALERDSRCTRMFNQTMFNEYLFITASCSLWMVVRSAEILRGFPYTNSLHQWEMSYVEDRVTPAQPAGPGCARWSFSTKSATTGKIEEPWLSIDDNNDAAYTQGSVAATGTMMYGENNFFDPTAFHTAGIKSGFGMNVYVRYNPNPPHDNICLPKTKEPSKAPSKMPTRNPVTTTPSNPPTRTPSRTPSAMPTVEPTTGAPTVTRPTKSPLVNAATPKGSSSSSGSKSKSKSGSKDSKAKSDSKTKSKSGSKGSKASKASKDSKTKKTKSKSGSKGGSKAKTSKAPKASKGKTKSDKSSASKGSSKGGSKGGTKKPSKDKASATKGGKNSKSSSSSKEYTYSPSSSPTKNPSQAPTKPQGSPVFVDSAAGKSGGQVLGASNVNGDSAKANDPFNPQAKNNGGFVGVLVGGIVVGLLLIAGAVFFWRRKKANGTAAEIDMSTVMGVPTTMTPFGHTAGQQAVATADPDDEGEGDYQTTV